ncbi:MAG: hypothetical protein K5886_11820 [Lachnospiraceae bacterium]|nr:hypothetical protein [Lachnospiraceae bacterium]
MTYTTLPEPARGCLLAFATLILIMFIYCIIRMLDAGRRNIYLVCTCVMSALAFSLYQGMVMYQQEDLASFDVPVWMIITVLVILLMYCAYIQYNIVVWQRSNITGMSVKEAFDRLPAGLAYYTESGVPVMVNETMQEISRSISGEGVRDACAFWERIKTCDRGDVSKDADSAIVRIKDNRIFSIRRRSVTAGGARVYELIASDISREYELTNELEIKRDRARVLNTRLKALMETIEYVSMNRELLKLKTALHDNIGQSILIAKRYLFAPDSVDKKRMLEFWQDNARHLVNDEPEEWELPYYVISKEADLMGIKLNIIGELPGERELIPVVDAAVSAQVSNTLKHTNGTQVTIEVADKGTGYCLSLKNDGEMPDGEIEPRGGLKNLQSEIRAVNGSMEIIYSPEFILKITLPKGESNAGQGSYSGGLPHDKRDI